MSEMLIKIPYHPRPAFNGFHASKKRFGVLVCHRRAGKTVAAINKIIRTILKCKRPNPRGAYVAPTFSQAKDIVWHYLKDYTATIPGVKYYEYDLRVDLPNGGRIKLYGAENPDRLRGLYFDIAVFDEYASMSPVIWEDVVRPALTDRGGEAIFLGTPKGMDAFYDLWKYAQENNDEWYCLDERDDHVMKASDTGIVPPEELASAFRLMEASKYAREYECDFTATFEGAYYAKEVQRIIAEKRVREVRHDPAADVYAAWDMGIDDSTAIWTFQCINREWRFLHYKVDSDLDLSQYISWCKSLPYKIDMHYLPHDAKVREYSTGKSRQLYMEERDLRTYVVKKHAVEDRIAAVRMTLPRCFFNAGTTETGLSALRMYRTVKKEREQVLSLKPLHDWASHGADAFGIGVMGVDEDYGHLYKPSDPKKAVNRSSEGSYA